MPTKNNRINIRDVYHRHRSRYDESVVLAVHVGFWLYFVYGDAHQVVTLLGEPLLEKADYPQVAIHMSRRNEVDDRLNCLHKKLVVYGQAKSGGFQIEARQYDFSRFEKVHAMAYADALADLKADAIFTGDTDWLFPRLQGLGDNEPNSFCYSLKSLAEARAYLKHLTLGAHLRELTDVLLAKKGRKIGEIFNPITARRVQSSLTLFSRIRLPKTRFREVLDQFYAGAEEVATAVVLDRAD